MGAMIRMLGGQNDAAKLVESVGKKIASVKVDGDVLRFDMEDGSTFGLTDMAQSCCESRHMSCDDDLTKFTGAEFRGARIADGPRKDDEYGYCDDSQFLIVETSLGEFTVVNHNEHNGYYGGFSMEVVP